MKRKLLRSIICFLLSVIIITECNLGTVTGYAAEITEEEMPTASSYLYPFEEAVIALEELAETRDIQAVVYLADTVTLRMLPEESSEPVKNLVSGDVVSIIGAGQDAEYNIWYQVSYKNELEEVTGYLRKDYVACVDEEFAKWQENYVRSIAMFSRMRGGYSYSDVEMFPESYQDALYELKQKHPNWIFVKMNTNLDWKSVVKSQIGNNSWIWASTAEESWKNGMTSDPSWAYASEGIIKYYLDPRNWMAEKDIFQFELLGYYSEYHTVENVESILSGTFMGNTVVENGKTYAQTFVELGKVTGVSPFLMAARVRQEQGTNGNSALISGTYQGYEGYYNYYNIGAYGNSVTETIVNGLKNAKTMGWNSRYASLEGGASFLGAEYVKAGQDTLYLQKFDVDSRMYGTCYHQYMQNIQAPCNEARSVYKAYSNKGLLNQAFIFRIPVYNNMSAKAAVLPGEEDKITLSSTNIDNLQVDSEITLHPYINGKEAEGVEWIFASSNEDVATVDSNGVVKALKSGETTITCKNAQDLENPNVGTCKITVIPADIDITKLEIPELEAITYDPDATLEDVVLPEGYTWVNPDMVPTVAQPAYGVTYNPDEEKYNPITFDITLNVKKGVLTSSDYSIPTGLEGGATRELRSVTLPVGFTWNDPQEKLASTIGTKEYLASYNPDSANYESVTNIKIPVKIICEKHNFGEWEITEATCEEDGIKIRKCTICNEKEELVLEKTGHHYESEITEEATEEKEGTRTYTCKDCGNTYTESIPKLPSTHVHKYEEYVTKKASCIEKGEKAFECSCGDIYTEIMEATGHKVENGRCQQCGYTEVVETPEDNNKPSEDTNTGNGSIGDNSKPSEDTNTGNGSIGDNSKPSEDKNTGNGSTGDSSKPSEDKNTGNSSTGDNSKPSEDKDSGNSGTDNSKPSDTGNTSSGSGSSTNGSSVNNSTSNNTNSNSGTTTNNTGSTNNNNSSTNNSSTTNNSSANNNTNSGGTTNNSTNNSSTTNNGTTNNNSTNSNTTTNNNTANNSSTNNNSTNSSSTTNNSTTNNNTSGSSTTNNSTIANNNTNSSSTTNNSTTNNNNVNSSNTNTSAANNSNSSTNNNVSNSNTENNSTVSNSTVNNNVTENNTEAENATVNNTEVTSTQNTTAPAIVQNQTTSESNENHVEVELMSGLIENAKDETADSEKQTVSIQLNKNTEISQKIVEMAKEHGVDLEVNLPNALKWTIKADSLTSDMASAINMNAEIVEEVIEKEIIDTVASENEYMELSLSHDGEFGFEATLTIPVEEKYAGKTANLFYFNEKTKELEFQMAALVDEDNNIQLEFNHASDYVIVFAENSMAEMASNENIPLKNNVVETFADSEKGETQEQNDKMNRVLIICLVIMVISGGLAAAGYFIYLRGGKKDNLEDVTSFEAWLKEDEAEKISEHVEQQSKKLDEVQEQDYFDDDVDDYQEKERSTEDKKSTDQSAGEKMDQNDYLDDEDDYLDEDVDDYKEKM